ncbi:MAG: glycogen debranching protein GlgX [Thermomicrobiales bacterium]
MVTASKSTESKRRSVQTGDEAKPAQAGAYRFTVERGSAHPLGAVPSATGVNFSVFSEHATAVTLLLFDEHDDPEPIQTIEYDSRINKSFHFWHVFVRGARPGMHYAYRVDGPRDLHGQGHRFNPNKVLIDPYSYGVTTNLWNRVTATGPDDNLATSMRSAIIDLDDYDWEGDRPINRPMNETIVYEMHVGGFTKSPSSEVKHPGTFAGIVEKIPYLKSLGITAVELLPVCQFDPLEFARPSPVDGRPLSNYWGYSTVGFFAPHPDFCATPEDASHIREFRDMVKALHQVGIEVILDVVFNHTSEGNHEGPTINFKGLENRIYYHLVPQDRQYYMDYSGCGNTFNCNHPIADKLILECLEFWVRDMHVDGFRFDEGSILSRGEDGAPMVYPPAVWHVELSEELADTKIIAEAWDAAGLYQIGYFPGYRWGEWNGRYRDDLRRFVRGEGGLIGAVASRIAGSSDIYEASGHLPMNSINFFNCHDGFTLRDLVSYNQKHNEANGENNRDGMDENFSWNCGVEGETDEAGVLSLRKRQMKNVAAILGLSQGVPMFVMGDEIGRTQHGNNNAYCQDNELSWMDWTPSESSDELFRFWSNMIAFRKRHPVLRRSRFFTGETNERQVLDIAWHGCGLNRPGWNDPTSRVLAFTLGGFDEDADLHVIMNMDENDLDFELPRVIGRRWLRAVDTGLDSPADIVEGGQEQPLEGTTYRAKGRSVVVLASK